MVRQFCIEGSVDENCKEFLPLSCNADHYSGDFCNSTTDSSHASPAGMSQADMARSLFLPISNYQLILIDSFCGRWYSTLQEWNGEWHLGKSDDDDDLRQLSLSGPLGLTTTIVSTRTWGDRYRLPLTRRIRFTQLDSSRRQSSESNWLNPIGNSWQELSPTHVLLLLFLSSFIQHCWTSRGRDE